MTLQSDGLLIDLSPPPAFSSGGLNRNPTLLSWNCLACYLEHVRVVVMAVLHHHRLVTGHGVGDAVLPPAVQGLQQQEEELMHFLAKSTYIRLDICKYPPKNNTR